MQYLAIDRGSRFDRVTLDCLKSQGNALVIRYLDDTFGQSLKSISEEESRAILDAGLSLLLVFETCGGANAPGCATFGAAYFTRDQGIFDAQHAVSQARKIGYPNGLPIFFAVDFSADLNDLQSMVEYFNGVYDILHGSAGDNPAYVIGIYGSYTVCKYAKDNWPAVLYYWQTYAWSNNQWLPEAQIRQVQNGVSKCGVIVDLDESDILGWRNQVATEFVSKADFDAYKADVKNSLDTMKAAYDPNVVDVSTLKTDVSQLKGVAAGLVSAVDGLGQAITAIRNALHSA